MKRGIDRERDFVLSPLLKDFHMFIYHRGDPTARILVGQVSYDDARLPLSLVQSGVPEGIGMQEPILQIFAEQCNVGIYIPADSIGGTSITKVLMKGENLILVHDDIRGRTINLLPVEIQEEEKKVMQ